MPLIGIINGDMIGKGRTPGEHIDWDVPDVYDEAILAAVLEADIDVYAAASPHMIVFDASDLVAACGDVMADPDDVKAHEATCGACEGAKEAATVWVALVYAADSRVEDEVHVFTTPEAASDWVDGSLTESFGTFDNFEDMGRSERLELAERFGVHYRVTPCIPHD